jgi:bis(5'-nucleosyl)-tetraphosphatase (symmetrical)
MVWAVGDIQGCHRSFKKLLKAIKFDPERDILWVAGDLVNRGDKSLKTLKYLYKHRESMRIVLGNHDLALIAAYFGIKPSNPTLDPILESKHAEKLITWLRSLPFVHVDRKLGYIMSHAGISPHFNLSDALRYNKKMQKRLQSDKAAWWLEQMMGDNGSTMSFSGTKVERERYIVSSFVRMRYCYPDGRLELRQKGSPSRELKIKGVVPWFLVKRHKKLPYKVIFGHWSTLGYYENKSVCCLDSGCLWGKTLTARRLDGKKESVVQIQC